MINNPLKYAIPWRGRLPEGVNFSDDLWSYHRFCQILRKSTEDPAEYEIGISEKGTPLYGFVFGRGAVTVSLIAGSHADEPVGPNTLYRLCLSMLHQPESFKSFLQAFRMLVIPHINPDGDRNNTQWIEQWPDLAAFLSGMRREPPGRDIEFGYPDMRVENEAAARFWLRGPPPDLHMSLHGMAFSEGYLLLLNDPWESRTREWRNEYDHEMRRNGLLPHDHDREGEKGFRYYGPGFASTPDGKAMRDYFLENKDFEKAGLFHDSSMEFHQARNPDVFCLVTELPLYRVHPSGTPGKPLRYLALRKELEQFRKHHHKEGISGNNFARRIAGKYGPVPLPVQSIMALQWYTIAAGMERTCLFVKEKEEKNG